MVFGSWTDEADFDVPDGGRRDEVEDVVGGEAAEVAADFGLLDSVFGFPVLGLSSFLRFLPLNDEFFEAELGALAMWMVVVESNVLRMFGSLRILDVGTQP